MTEPSSRADYQPAQGGPMSGSQNGYETEIVSPSLVSKTRRCSSADDVERQAAEAHREVLAHAERAGITLSGDVEVQIQVVASARGYERKKGDGLADAEWQRLVEAHDGHRPLAWARLVGEPADV